MIRSRLNNVTKVRSTEDIMDARCALIEIILPLSQGHPDMHDIVLEADAKSARALARALNRHANFIDPRGKRR